MNILDITITVLIAFLIVRGLFRGFFREIGSLAGVILGISLANLYQPQVTGLLESFLPSGRFLPLVGFALIFLVVLILCNFVGRGLRNLFKKVPTGWTDRILGAGLATLKGLMITYLGIVLLNFFVPSKAPLIAKSKLAPLIITSYQSMIRITSQHPHKGQGNKFPGSEKATDRGVSKETRGLRGRDGLR